MILGYKDYEDISRIDVNSFGKINESHQYADSVASVMDKITFFVKREMALETSSLNESAKRAYSKDIRFNRNEKIAASCIFNEMLKKYESNMKEEIALCEAIINEGSLLEEGVEYDMDALVEKFSINEGIGDWVKKKLGAAAGKVADTAKEIASDAKDLTVKGVKVVKAKKDDLVAWAKEAKKDFEEKYEGLKKLIEDIVKKGVDSVTAFINNVLEVFTSIGDNLVDAVKKLGGLKMDKDEKPATIDIEDAEGIYANAKTSEEKSFINNIINRVNAILNQDKEQALKLMNESYVNESVVDNKFIAWFAGYKSNGEKMNWWACMLIGICASIIVWILPKVLVGVGLGAALASFIGALVGVIWNGIGLLKLIYKRNKERKPSEKFFNKTTAIFFLMSVLSMTFSVVTFVKTIGPLMREICNHFGIAEGADMSAFGKWFYELTKKVSPKNAFHEGGIREWTEEVKDHGGDFRSGDIASSNKMLADAAESAGASDTQMSVLNKFLEELRDSKGTSGVYKVIKNYAENKDLLHGFAIDGSEWGKSAKFIKEAIDQLSKNSEIGSNVMVATGGSLATQAASGGQYGFASLIMNASKSDVMKIFKLAKELAKEGGADASQIHLTEFGSVMLNTIKHVERIPGSFDVLAPDVPFIPMVMPFFDKKKWGKYKMRFASATRGSSAYTVDKVEMMPYDKIGEESPALSTLKQLHDNAWSDYQKLNAEEVSEDKKDEKKKVEEPQFVVFYVRDNESTKNESDNVDKKEKDTKKKVAVGVVIDTLTMMCADVCNFNKSVEKRRRPLPYFMKGLLSRLSFRPLEDNDNDTKEYIRTTLGQTMKTVILQNVLYGAGKKYIDSKVKGEKAEYTLRETVLGEEKKKVNGGKEMFELGNFSPNEILKCLNDDTKNNKVSYEFLDGDHASKISIRKDADGNIKSTSASKDNTSIENVRYYKVKRAAHKEAMDDYEKEKKKFKDGKLEKRPSKPSFIKGEDGEWYKRASKKMMADEANKRKKLYDFVDIKIKPLLKKGELYKKLVEDKLINKMLYIKDDEGNVKLRKEVVIVLKPFLYRPEKTFSREDEHDLRGELKKVNVTGEKLGWFKNLFKDEEQLHDTFKKLVEMIWDYLSENRRKVFKEQDFHKTHKKASEKIPEAYEDTTLYDMLIEEFINDDYDDDTEYQYDMNIINEENRTIHSFRRFINENYR